MRILRTLVLIAASIFHFAASAQDVGILHLRPLHLELPSTWNFDGTKRPIEGRGPNGEKVLISILRKQSTSESLRTAQDTAKSFAQGPMRDLATKNGKTIVRPLSELPVQDGKAGYSVGSETSSLFGGKSYFVQYLLAAPDVIIYFTFEGKGDTEQAMQRFDQFFATQRWDE
jgi:hypothetical protein